MGYGSYVRTKPGQGRNIAKSRMVEGGLRAVRITPLCWTLTVRGSTFIIRNRGRKDWTGGPEFGETIATGRSVEEVSKKIVDIQYGRTPKPIINGQDLMIQTTRKGPKWAKKRRGY